MLHKAVGSDSNCQRPFSSRGLVYSSDDAPEMYSVDISVALRQRRRRPRPRRICHGSSSLFRGHFERCCTKKSCKSFTSSTKALGFNTYTYHIKVIIILYLRYYTYSTILRHTY